MRETVFLDIVEKFEETAAKFCNSELLDLHFMGYAFGSGFSVYRINGRNVMIEFDGKESRIKLLVSNPHEKYPSSEWSEAFASHLDEWSEDCLKFLADYCLSGRI